MPREAPIEQSGMVSDEPIVVFRLARKKTGLMPIAASEARLRILQLPLEAGKNLRSKFKESSL
jgi:hypothetical protein